jgi:hypothetical protein
VQCVASSVATPAEVSSTCGAIAHLRALRRVLDRGRRLGHGAALAQRVVERLRGALGEVELVAQVGGVLVTGAVALRLLLLRVLRCSSLLVVLALLLLLRVVGCLVEQAALLRKVVRQLVYGRFHLEFLRRVVPANNVDGRPGVVRFQDLCRLLVEFLVCEHKLIARLHQNLRRLPLILRRDHRLIVAVLRHLDWSDRRRWLGLGLLLLRLRRHRLPARGQRSSDGKRVNESTSNGGC